MRPTSVATSAAWKPPRIAARRLNILVQSPSRVIIMARPPSRLRQESHLRLGEQPGDDGIERDGHEAGGDHGAERSEAGSAGKTDADPADERGAHHKQRKRQPGKTERAGMEELLLFEDGALTEQQDERTGSQRRAREQVLEHADREHGAETQE